MRDIRQDLEERLKGVDDAFRAIEEKYKSLEAQRATLRAMLAAENERWGVLSQKPLPLNGDAPPPESDGTTLSIILREQMADNRRHHLGDLSEAAVKRGYPFGEKKPGRVVHFALLGMKSGNLVEQLGEGYWKLRQQH